VGYCPPEQLPYLSIDTWIADLDMERIDEFVDLAQGCPAIIIDVRMNSGGNNLLCQEVAGRFASTTVLSWMSRTRTGTGYDDCAYDDVITSPAGPMQYTGTVYVLIGECCASSTEDFVCSMMELPNVVLLGDTTLGAGCCPAWVELPNRWQYTSIEWSTRTAWNQPVEWLGLAPDIPVEATAEDFAQGCDPLLEYAIGLVKVR
jgi:C-terminal processing protease CtpA/Prc